jgi:hypothetical protein
MSFSRSHQPALAALLLVLPTVACSGGDDDDSSGQCTTLHSEGFVAATLLYDSVPEPSTGGELAEGTYHLTAYSVHFAPNSQVAPRCYALSDVLLLSSGSFQHAFTCYFDADDPSSRLGGGIYAGSYLVSDTDFSFNYTCPGAKVEKFSYSAESSTLRLLSPDPTGSLTTELVWTLE